MKKTLHLEGALIGMIHLQPLPGAPRYQGSMNAVVDAALADAETLAQAGVDAVLIENFGDTPFFRGSVGPETVAAMTAIANRVGRQIDLPLGINVLRNDGPAAVAIAVAVGACFVRVNVLSWARLTDQGIIEGDAAGLQRLRARLNANDVLILADVAVKHSAPLAPVPIEEEARDVIERGLADAVVVTGTSTGAPVNLNLLQTVTNNVEVPVLVGSGTTPETVPSIRRIGAGAIVGSSMMRDGRAGNPVELDRARRLIAAWKGTP